MLRSRAADFAFDAVGLTEVDCHITIFHRRFDSISRSHCAGYLNFLDRSGPDRAQFFHAPRRADEQCAHGRILHGREQRAIASIQSLPASCEGAPGSLRSSRTTANELQMTLRRASQALFHGNAVRLDEQIFEQRQQFPVRFLRRFQIARFAGAHEGADFSRHRFDATLTTPAAPTAINGSVSNIVAAQNRKRIGQTSA